MTSSREKRLEREEMARSGNTASDILESHHKNYRDNQRVPGSAATQRFNADVMQDKTQQNNMLKDSGVDPKQYAKENWDKQNAYLRSFRF